jgi:hypothetical protein
MQREQLMGLQILTYPREHSLFIDDNYFDNNLGQDIPFNEGKL